MDLVDFGGGVFIVESVMTRDDVEYMQYTQ